MQQGLRIALAAAALVAGSFALDQLVWTLRGSPAREIDVSVLTTMELKNHKEDYGTPDTETVSCPATLLPFPARGGWSTPCWWLERHREIIRRY